MTQVRFPWKFTVWQQREFTWFKKKKSPSRDPFSLQSITWAAFCQNSLERKLPGLAQFLAAKEIFCRMVQVIREVSSATEQFLDSELHACQDFASLTFLAEPWQKRPTLRAVSTGKTSHRSRQYYGGSNFLLKNVPTTCQIIDVKAERKGFGDRQKMREVPDWRFTLTSCIHGKHPQGLAPQ